MAWIKVLTTLFFIYFSASIPTLGRADTKQSATTLKAKLDQVPTDVTSRTKLAEIYFKQKNYKAVVSTLDPYSADLKVVGLDLLAKAYLQQGDSFNELRILKRIVAQNPEEADLHIRLGKAYIKQNKVEEAVQSVRKALQLEPKSETGYVVLLDIFKKQDNNYESQLIVKDMISRFGKKAPYVNELCRIYTQEAFLDEAITTCKEAITLNTNFPDNHAYLAHAYNDKGNQEMAEGILKRSAERFKKSEFVQKNAGNFYFNLKNFGASARYFSQAVLANRKSSEAHLGMARSSFQLGKFEQALIGFENACQLDKDSIRYFKEAAAQLRLDRNYRWEHKYNAALSRCQ